MLEWQGTNGERRVTENVGIQGQPLSVKHLGGKMHHVRSCVLALLDKTWPFFENLSFLSLQVKQNLEIISTQKSNASIATS